MKRTVLIGCAVGAVVVLLLWYLVLFSPTSSDLNDTRDQVSGVQSQNQELENTIRQLKALSRNSVEQQAKLRTLRAAIPSTPDLGEFILQANDIASASGIDWLSIAPTPPAAGAAGGPTSTITISMQIQGQFSAVLDYLNRLEDLERLVVVDTVNVSTAAADRRDRRDRRYRDRQQRDERSRPERHDHRPHVHRRRAVGGGRIRRCGDAAGSRWRDGQLRVDQLVDRPVHDAPGVQLRIELLMAAAKSSNRRVLIILGVGGVLVALLAAFNLLQSGGDDGGSGSNGAEVAPTASQTAGNDGTATTTTPTPTPTTTPAAPSLPSGDSFDSFTNRNPFEPAVVVTQATTPTSPSPDESASAGTPPATSAPTNPGSDQPAAGTTVALVEVFDQAGTTTAVVQVGSQQYTVAAGQVFATSYKVVAISGTCGQFLYGDSPFTLCQGEQVIK